MGCTHESQRDRPSLPLNFSLHEANMVEELQEADHEGDPIMVHKWSQDISLLSVVVSPKRNLMFCGTQDSKIVVFDLDTYTKKYELKSHFGSVLCLTISLDENFLFSGGSDSTVKIYDLTTMEETHTIYSLMDIGDVFSIAFSDQLNTVFFGTQNASILYAHLKSISPKDDASFLPLNRPDKFFDSPSVSGLLHQSQNKTNKFSHTTTNLIEIPSLNIIRYAHNGFIYALKLIKRNPRYDFFNGIPEDVEEILISTGGDGLIKIWGLQNGLNLIKTLDNEESTLSITLNQSYLYCGLTNGQVRVWDLSTFQHLRTIQSDEEDIFAMSIYNDCLFKGTKSGVTKLKLMGDIKSDWIAHQGLAVTVEIFQSLSNNNHYLITGGLDNSLILWDLHRLNNNLSHRRSTLSLNLNNELLLETLKDLISFPTVSKKPEIFMDESRKCANYLKTLFKKLGAHSQLLPVKDGNPIVYAVFEGSKQEQTTKPRILWYGHYDIIEATSSNTDQWLSSPYKLTAQNGYLFGRGVTDNKGPLLLAVYAVAELYQEAQLYSDIVFIIEGEEESGSFGFQDVILENRELIGDIDWVLLSNSYWLDNEIPCLNYGLRGVISAQLEIFNDSPDRHSGFEGADGKSEPAMDLMKVVSSLTDKDNNILISGFYDSITNEKSELELENYKTVIKRTKLNLELDKLLSKWCKPSLSIHILDVSGPRNSTVIPHSATLTISIRVVPEQDLSAIKKSLQAHILEKFKKLNTDNTIKFEILHESEPWLGDPQNLAFQILREEIGSEWNIEPLFVREGGSIPSIRFLEKTFNAKLCQVPCGQSTDKAHLPNENLRILNLYKTRNILKKSFQKLPRNV